MRWMPSGSAKAGSWVRASGCAVVLLVGVESVQTEATRIGEQNSAQGAAKSGEALWREGCEEQEVWERSRGGEFPALSSRQGRGTARVVPWRR